MCTDGLSEETKTITAALKKSTVKLAIESNQPLPKKTEALDVNKNTLHTLISKYQRQQKQKDDCVKEEQIYDVLRRLRQ